MAFKTGLMLQLSDERAHNLFAIYPKVMKNMWIIESLEMQKSEMIAMASPYLP